MKKAVVYLKGGFGNQLFQLSFANFLKQNKYNVTISTDLMAEKINQTTRQLILPLKYFGFKKENRFNLITFKSLHKLNHSRASKYLKIDNILSKYQYLKEHNEYEKIKNKKLHLNGYWKNPKYINFSKDFIASCLKKDHILNRGFQNNNSKALIHVRRRDFVINNWQLDASYYEESLELLMKNHGNVKFDVFTDDRVWVENSKIFRNAENIYSQSQNNSLDDKSKVFEKDDKNETISTFSKMLEYQHFIAGNSSFAFWAAFLKSTEESFVTVPEPWFYRDSHITLKKDSWKVIKNRRN
tara:strand:+ start:1889 stop:2782 length:894 start_codon:yes stop_codon:yes gene_type:complete